MFKKATGRFVIYSEKQREDIGNGRIVLDTGKEVEFTGLVWNNTDRWENHIPHTDAVLLGTSSNRVLSYSNPNIDWDKYF